LKLEFITQPASQALVCFLIIYPVDKAAVVEPDIATLWNDIRYRFNEMSYQQATPHIARTMNLPGIHEEFIDPAAAAKRSATLAALPDAKEGLLTFGRDPIEEVYPDTVPSV